MVRTTTLILLFLLSSCQTTRLIDLCMIEEPVAHCARKDDKYQLPYPSGLVKWYAWDQLDMEHLASRLAQCEEDGKLPRSDKTLEEMDICIIGSDCGFIEGFYATDPSGYQKIKDKLDWCKR